MNKLSFLPFMATALLIAVPTTNSAQTFQAEKLYRSPIAITTSSGNLVSWRTLPSDVANGISFRLSMELADGTTTQVEIAQGQASTYLDTRKATAYTLEVFTAGTLTQIIEGIEPESPMRQVKLNRPAGGSTSTGSYTYTPNDCSVGDVDGDGEYEIIVKWDPSNSQDNSKSDYKTGNTIFDCYEITGLEVGKHLWRIDLGVNVRAGAHYSPFLVYDFDGDGKAEFVVKTAPGSKDSQGNYVSAAGKTDDIRNIKSNTTDYRNSGGHILKGEEFLTIFSGETGQALQTVWYWPNHARKAAPGSASTTYSWSGDSYGNRGHRYNACVAYLDGVDQRPSIVMQRGYYTQAYFWAVDWDGSNLQTRWLHEGTSASAWDVINANGTRLSSGSGKSSYGQGVHGISVADVDEDGCDEIIMGSTTIDHDGRLLCSTGFGHGDAIHVGKFIPGRPGYQIYMPHEESGCKYGDDLHDAATGEILYRGYTEKDNGRGMAGDYIYQFDAATGLDKYPGWEMWSGAMSSPMNAITLEQIGKKPDTNFRIYWNGDLFDDSFDGRFDSGSNNCNPRIVSWTGTGSTTVTLSNLGGKPQSCNYTKATPCLTADLYGDWREEVVCWDSSDAATLDIYTTNISTKYPVPSPMTDHNYRLGVVWQNSSYNQPPHLGYSLAETFLCQYEVVDDQPLTANIKTGEPYRLAFKVSHCDEYTVNNPKLVGGMEYTFNNGLFVYEGTPTETGTFTRTFTFKGRYGHDCKATVKLIIEQGAALECITNDASDDAPRYDLMGRPANAGSKLVVRKNKKLR